ncbi:PadR family transcriptional regulator [bacterium]|nr:PadR family transcriptional regulator [bacterium]
MTKNDLVVLGLLKEKPMYGYQTKQQIKLRKLDHWAHLSLPSIYSTLNRMEKRGLISGNPEKVGKMPQRTVYKMTSKGEKELARLVEKALVSDKIPEEDFSVGVAFMYGLEKEKVVSCLQKRVGILERQLAHLKDDLRFYQNQVPFNWVCLMRNGADHIQLEIDNIEKMLKMLKKGRTWDDLIKDTGQKRRRT